ncbi:MAG: Rieske 2Fe-2S domain-containing protein, partial [Alphaproteobacteria bacterium]|nr:Rieske 2Fe-2S domain-containing protein [Alphaproteobacteria bacterium]
MFDGTPDEISGLVRPGQVHRRVYTDSEVFELELARLFGRAWVYVGHESQTPKPGDFITTEIGRQPVIVVRGADGAIRVLLNRCSHRGAKVANEPCGHAERLTCLYHGWSYDLDGALAAVPDCLAGFAPEQTGPQRLQFRYHVSESPVPQILDAVCRAGLSVV